MSIYDFDFLLNTPVDNLPSTVTTTPTWLKPFRVAMRAELDEPWWL